MKPLSYLMAATGVASILALLEMPFDYYIMLRGLVSVSAVLLGVFAVTRRKFGWLAIAIPAFALWFPLFGVTMERESWAVLNVLAAAGFLFAWQKFDFSEKKTS